MINTQFASSEPAIPLGLNSPVDRNPLRRLDRYIDNYEPSFERMAKARNAIRSNDCRVQRFDHILACPERINSKSLRALVHASKYLEELGEAISDLSGWIERAWRNVLSGGNKNDIAQVLGSGLGRVISGFASTPGIAVHKVAGACLLGLSAITGGLAVVGVTALGAKRRLFTEHRPLNQGGHFETSIYQEVAGATSKAKSKVLNRLMNKLDKAGYPQEHALHKWCRHLSPHHTIHNESDNWARRTHCNYIWKNLHQYGGVTKALMYSAYGVFQGVNKIMGSYDKYLGAELGKRVIAKKLGNLLGLKIGLCLAAGVAAGLSVPMAPLVVGLSTVCACACAFALLALVAAKLNVQHGHDWRGNLALQQNAPSPA